MVDEETRKFCLLIRDDIKVFGILCSHRKFFGVGDDFVFDGDWCGGVEEFKRNEDFSVFYRQIYWILWLTATKFDGNQGSVAIVDKFNFGGMGDDAFVACGGWWSEIRWFFNYSIFGWLGGLSGVFRISAERHDGR